MRLNLSQQFVSVFSHAFNLYLYIYFFLPQATKCILQQLFPCFASVSSSSTRGAHLTHELRCDGLPNGFRKRDSEAKQQDFPRRIFELIMFKNKNVKISSASNS